MPGLVTAPLQNSYTDFGHADQDGEVTDRDTVYFCLKHPPWMCMTLNSIGTLEGLEPPSKLTRDWNKTVIYNSIPETWEEVDYEERYREHLRTNKKAGKDLRRVLTLSKHQDVCLICQDQFYQFCIRRIIYEYIQENT